VFQKSEELKQAFGLDGYPEYKDFILFEGKDIGNGGRPLLLQFL